MYVQFSEAFLQREFGHEIANLGKVEPGLAAFLDRSSSSANLNLATGKVESERFWPLDGKLKLASES